MNIPLDIVSLVLTLSLGGMIALLTYLVKVFIRLVVTIREHGTRINIIEDFLSLPNPTDKSEI